MLLSSHTTHLISTWHIYNIYIYIYIVSMCVSGWLCKLLWPWYSTSVSCKHCILFDCSVCLCLFICLSVCALSVCTSVCMCICLSVHLSVCLYICISAHVYVLLCVCLSRCDQGAGVPGTSVPRAGASWASAPLCEGYHWQLHYRAQLQWSDGSGVSGVCSWYPATQLDMSCCCCCCCWCYCCFLVVLCDGNGIANSVKTSICLICSGVN